MRFRFFDSLRLLGLSICADFSLSTLDRKVARMLRRLRVLLDHEDRKNKTDEGSGLEMIGLVGYGNRQKKLLLGGGLELV